MAFLCSYNEGDYEITQYSSGGTVRDRMTQKIIAEYENPWTPDGSPHPTAIQQVDMIEKSLGIKITL